MGNGEMGNGEVDRHRIFWWTMTASSYSGPHHPCVHILPHPARPMAIGQYGGVAADWSFNNNNADWSFNQSINQSILLAPQMHNKKMYMK